MSKENPKKNRENNYKTNLSGLLIGWCLREPNYINKMSQSLNEI